MTGPTTEPEKTTLAGKTRQMIALKPHELEARGLPPERAKEKAQSTAAGWLSAFLGLTLMVGAGYTAYGIVESARDISLMVVILVSVLGGLGLIVFGVGMTLISRDASPAIAGAGELIVKLIRAVRGGGGAT